MGDDGGDASSSRWQCPYPGCRRSFAELWRLKVHYRAPPDVRGSGRERGHGTELAQCPKCGKALKPGKHHVGCAAGRTAPRQASKRSRANSASDKAIAAAAAAAASAKAHAAAPTAPALGGAPANEYGLPQFGPAPSPAPLLGTQHSQPLPQMHSQQQQQQALQPPPSPISAMLLQHGCRVAPQPGTPLLGDAAPGMPHHGAHHGSSGSLPADDLADVFDGMDDWALRAPSPPPPARLLPAAGAAAAAAGRGAGMIFDFAQFQQPLPPAPASHVPAFEEERLGAVWGDDLTYEAKTDGDVMRLLFGAPDCPPEMATIHLHQFADGPGDGATSGRAFGAGGAGQLGGGSPFPPASPFDWGGGGGGGGFSGNLLQPPLLPQQPRTAPPPPLPGLPLLLPSGPHKAEPGSGGSSCSAGTALCASVACESLVASFGMVKQEAPVRNCADAGARASAEPALYHLLSSCE